LRTLALVDVIPVNAVVMPVVNVVHVVVVLHGFVTAVRTVRVIMSVVLLASRTFVVLFLIGHESSRGF